MTDCRYYRQLQAGAEYLAGLTGDPSERATHLKMAGVYYLRARQEGDVGEDAAVH